MKISSGMVNPVQISSAAQGLSGKVTLPVQRSDSIYAHYKYVQGIPAGRNQNSVPIKRLELINNMIESLQNLNKIVSDNYARLSDEGDVVKGTADVQQIGSLIHEKLQAIPASFASADASAVTTGMAFSLAV